MEPFNHVLKQAADVTIRGEYTTRNLPGGVDLLTIAAGATLTLSGDLIAQFAAVNRADQGTSTATQEQGRPQSALEGAVKPNQTAGTTNAPQAGSVAGGSDHFNLGQVDMVDGQQVTLPFPSADAGAGEFLVRCAPNAKLDFVFVPPEYAVKPGKVGFIKLAAVPGGDNYVGKVGLATGPTPADVLVGLDNNQAPFLPFLINERVSDAEKPGYYRFETGTQYCLSVIAMSGTFMIQVQNPQ